MNVFFEHLLDYKEIYFLELTLKLPAVRAIADH